MLIYVVFPEGKAPSQVDRRKLEGCHDRKLFNHFRTGTDTSTGGFAIELLNTEYQRAYDRDKDFQQLVNTWKERGCKITNLVEFKRALGSRPSTKEPPQESGGKHKEGSEAWAEMQLGGARAMVERFKDFGVATKAAMITLPVLGAAIIGGKVACDLQEKPLRRNRIQDVIDNPMGDKPKATIDPKKAEAAKAAGRPDSFEDRVNTPESNERGGR